MNVTIRLVGLAAAAMFALAGLLVLIGFPSSGQPTRAEAATLPALSPRWPHTTLQLGMADSPGGAANMKQSGSYGFRYQYLAGGVNTGNGWANWNANGQFVTYYIQDSAANGITPVFTYYMIRQTNPGAGQTEAAGVYNNLQSTTTMVAYYNDLKLFFQRAGATGSTAVLHMEPDFWAYMQQRSTGDNAATIPAQVSSTGLPELAGLPNTVSGFAMSVKKLRDTYAPNVAIAYHTSVWGTGNDIMYSNPDNATVDALGQRSANFYRSLNTDFDVSFADFIDRDAAFKQFVYGDGGASWWDAGDFSRYARFLAKFVEVSGERVAIWQIPFGNTKMRAMDNTWNHYQDNHVEWLLDDPTRAHLNEYVQAGVIAFMFGRGADGATCACDANGDGVTNPAAINGNTTVSYNADDDGGFFRNRAAAYFSAAAIALPGGGPTATATATPTSTSSPTPTSGTSPTATPTPTSTPTPIPTATSTPPSLTWSPTAAVSTASIRVGRTQRITATVGASANASALIDVEVYDPNGVKVHQAFFDNQSFSAGIARSFVSNWKVPSGATRGTYTVKVGVFSPGWGTLHSWNGAAVTFTVR